MSTGQSAMNDALPMGLKGKWLIPYVDKRVDGRYKISAVDETGDRLATIDMGRKVGELLCPVFFEGGGWVSI